MRIPESKLNEITDKISITDIVGEYVTLKAKGDRLWGCCPFHHEKSPSFSVTPGKNLFYCFGCHEGGTLFSFIQKIENISFVEAVKIIAQKAGVTLNLEGGPSYEEDKKRIALVDLYKRVTGSFHYILNHSPKAQAAREYLKNRGINQNTIETFQLGYAPDDKYWLHNFLIQKKYSKEFLAETGLFSQKYEGFPFFRDRIIFPINNIRGEVIAFGGRLLKGEGPKYLNSRETRIFKKREELFGLYQGAQTIRKEKEFILVEGYMDVLSMFQAGIQNTVAPLGTAFTEEQAKKVSRYAEKAKLFFDGDTAGFKAAMKSAYICLKNNIPSEVPKVQEGLDPADILEKEGPEALKKILKYPINSFEYFLQKLISENDMTRPENKVMVANKLFEYIKVIDSEVEKEGYLQILANYLDVDKENLVKDLKKQSGHTHIVSRPPEKSELPKPRERVRQNVEIFLMLAIINNRDYYAQVRNEISPDDFEDEYAKLIFVALEESYRKGEKSLELLLEKIEIPGLRDMILSKIATDEFSINQAQVIHETIKRIRRSSLLRKREKIIQLLRKLERNNADPEEINEILLEKMYLDAELR